MYDYDRGGGQVCVSDIYTSSRSSMENISENSMTGGAGRQSECGSSRIQPRQGDECGQVASLSQLQSRHEKQMEARSRTALWLRWERRVTKTIFQRGGEARKFLSAVRILHSVRHCQQAQCGWPEIHIQVQFRKGRCQKLVRLPRLSLNLGWEIHALRRAK